MPGIYFILEIPPVKSCGKFSAAFHGVNFKRIIYSGHSQMRKETYRKQIMIFNSSSPLSVLRSSKNLPI